MKISQLPKELKEKALNYQINASITWDKKTDILDFAFDWSKTIEGHYYWFNFQHKEFKNKNLLEIIYDKISTYLFGGINCNPKG